MSQPLLKVLALTMECPRMPGSGGQVRSWFFLKALAEKTELTLVSLALPGAESSIESGLSDKCRKVIENKFSTEKGVKPRTTLSYSGIIRAMLFPSHAGWRDFLTLCLQYAGPQAASDQANWPVLRRLLASVLFQEHRILSKFLEVPPLTTFLYHEGFENLTIPLNSLAGESFDVIWHEHTIIYPYADKLHKKHPSAVMVCNAHNVETLLQARIARRATTRRERQFAATQRLLFKRLERRAFHQADLVITCSNEDSAAVGALVPRADAIAIPNGVDSQYFRRPEDAERSRMPTLLFTGTFGYGPNQDALAWFINEILPLVHDEIPECRFIFAGRGATAGWDAVSGSRRDPRIESVNNPEDIRPCFHEAWVVVAPLLAGGGTRLKIFEAMAMEVPVVSTTLGAEGIPLKPGFHALLADTPVAFAEAIVRLIREPELRETVANRALDFARNSFDWQNIMIPLRGALASVVERKTK